MDDPMGNYFYNLKYIPILSSFIIGFIAMADVFRDSVSSPTHCTCIVGIDLQMPPLYPLVKLLHNYGKIHHVIAGKIHYFYGHVQ